MGPEAVGRLFIVETAVVTASKPFKQLGFLSRSVEPSPLTGALCYRQTRAGSPHAGNGASTADVIAFGRGQTPAAAQTWRDLERYRRFFPRALVVKGILNPADTVRAAEIGVDGIIVPNHQLDQAPASLEALRAIKAAVGDKVTVMLDSGVRRGADILIALCLGAQFVFFGRPTLYGAVAGGLPGVKKALDIFRGEIDLVMGQIGCPSLDQLGPDFLWRDDWARNA